MRTVGVANFHSQLAEEGIATLADAHDLRVLGDVVGLAGCRAPLVLVARVIAHQRQIKLAEVCVQRVCHWNQRSAVAAAILNLELQNVMLSLPGKLYRLA